MKAIDQHVRVTDSLLSHGEQIILNWLVARLPIWITPDGLTALALVGAVVTFAGYSLGALSPNFIWMASLGIVLNWFGDSLDGNLARYRKIERPRYGFFVDHTVDTVNAVLMFMGLALSPYVGFEVASLALISYLMVAVMVFVATCVTGVFRLSFGKVGPTELRVFAIAGNIWIYVVGNPAIMVYPWRLAVGDLVLATFAAASVSYFVVAGISQAVQLARLDEQGGRTV